jgi:hypothetical protein
MWDFKLGAAFGAMQRTLPFLLARMLVYFGIALFYVFSTGVGGALGYGFTRFGDGEGEGEGRSTTRPASSRNASRMHRCCSRSIN